MKNSRPSFWGPEYDGLSSEERLRQVQRDQNQWDLLQAQEKANELKEQELRGKGYNTSYPDLTNYKPLSRFSELLLDLVAIAFVVALVVICIRVFIMH